MTDDIPENNMFFDKSWKDVSNDEIVNIANRMNNELGGWVFHTRVDFDKPTPWYSIDSGHPNTIKKWLKERK